LKPPCANGEEFGDESDLALSYPQKFFDAVNWDRLQHAIDQAQGGVAGGQADTTWRARVRDHVRALCRLRASHPAPATTTPMSSTATSTVASACWPAAQQQASSNIYGCRNRSADGKASTVLAALRAADA